MGIHRLIGRMPCDGEAEVGVKQLQTRNAKD